MSRYSKNLERGEKELTQMRYRDLKIACIARGMLFEDVVEGTADSLRRYFLDNYDKVQDRNFLEQFDEWVKSELIKRGHAEDSPMVKFRLCTSTDSEENITINTRSLKNAQVKKAKKSKRERDPTHNIFSGTKKSLTYACATSGLTIKDTIDKVLIQFPDAQEKSIKIWFKKALKP